MSDQSRNLGFGDIAKGFMTWASPGYRQYVIAKEKRQADEARLAAAQQNRINEMIFADELAAERARYKEEQAVRDSLGLEPERFQPPTFKGIGVPVEEVIQPAQRRTVTPPVAPPVTLPVAPSYATPPGAMSGRMTSRPRRPMQTAALPGVVDTTEEDEAVDLVNLPGANLSKLSNDANYNALAFGGSFVKDRIRTPTSPDVPILGRESAPSTTTIPMVGATVGGTGQTLDEIIASAVGEDGSLDTTGVSPSPEISNVGPPLSTIPTTASEVGAVPMNGDPVALGSLPPINGQANVQQAMAAETPTQSLRGLAQIVSAEDIRAIAPIVAQIKEPARKRTTIRNLLGLSEEQYPLTPAEKINRLKLQKLEYEVQETSLGPGAKKRDEQLIGKDIPEYMNKRAQITQQIEDLKRVINIFEGRDPAFKPEDISGSFSTGMQYNIGIGETGGVIRGQGQRFVGTVLESITSQTLKAILGGQFAKSEADRLLAYAFDPFASPEENARRAKNLLEQVEDMRKVRESQIAHLKDKKFKTLSDWTPDELGNIKTAQDIEIDGLVNEFNIPREAARMMFNTVRDELYEYDDAADDGEGGYILRQNFLDVVKGGQHPVREKYIAMAEEIKKRLRTRQQ